MRPKHEIDSFTVSSGELERINRGMEQRGGDARHIISIVREEVRGEKVGTHFYRVFYRVPLVDESTGYPISYEEEIKRLEFEAKHMPPKLTKPTKRPKFAGVQSLPGCCVFLLLAVGLIIVSL
jgi:hypothetical protein